MRSRHLLPSSGQSRALHKHEEQLVGLVVLYLFVWMVGWLFISTITKSSECILMKIQKLQIDPLTLEMIINHQKVDVVGQDHT